MKIKVLIIGKIPPPVGGVTIHVSRLIADLKRREYKAFDFYNLQTESLWKLFFQLPQYKTAHLHVSNAYFQLFIALYCRLVNTRLIITYHGNWGRFGYFKNITTFISAWVAFIPVVQNQGSLTKAKRFNKSSILISAFIPLFDLSPLSHKIFKKLLDYRKKYKYLFCTNAGNLSFDKKGNEIYGISALVTKISNSAQSALIISDPSGIYNQYISKNLGTIPENIFFITEIHDFWHVLGLSDAFIRNTTTDGDSISIHEAMACEVTVFASDCVSRPSACILFADINKIDLDKELEVRKANFWFSSTSHQIINDVTGQLIVLYDQCLFK